VEQAGAVSLFTADLVVWLGVAELSPAAPAAAALAEVGADPSGTDPSGADLPAPPARNVALVDHGCGAHPGGDRDLLAHCGVSHRTLASLAAQGRRLAG
jgi:hypothetical protein